MKYLTILECLCYIGNTERTGIFSTSSEDINTTLKNLFGGKIICDGTIKAPCNYLYSYEDRLVHPKYGEIGANAVVEVTSPEKNLINNIFLYEIEE